MTNRLPTAIVPPIILAAKAVLLTTLTARAVLPATLPTVVPHTVLLPAAAVLPLAPVPPAVQVPPTVPAAHEAVVVTPVADIPVAVTLAAAMPREDVDL